MVNAHAHAWQRWQRWQQSAAVVVSGLLGSGHLGLCGGRWGCLVWVWQRGECAGVGGAASTGSQAAGTAVMRHGPLTPACNTDGTNRL